MQRDDEQDPKLRKAAIVDDSDVSVVPPRRGNALAAFVYRVRVIFIPFVLCQVGFVAAYTLLSWLLMMRDGQFIVPELVAVYFLPTALAWVPLIIWMRPRLTILKLTDGTFRRLVIMWAALLVPAFFAQTWLIEYAGDLRQARHIADFANAKDTKFFQIDSLWEDLNQFSYQIESEITGRYGKRRSFTMGLVVPLRDLKDTATGSSWAVWLASHSTTQTGAHADDSVMRRVVGELYQSSLRKLAERRLSNFAYLQRVGPKSMFLPVYEAAVKKSFIGGNVADFQILEGHTEPFENRGRRQAMYTVIAAGLGFVAVLIMVVFSKLDPKQLRGRIRLRRAESSGMIIRRYLQPRYGYSVTPVLAVATTALFVAMLVLGNGRGTFSRSMLVQWGAMQSERVIGGEWWRLVTALFVHANLYHILNSVLFLMLVGWALESWIGSLRFAAAFLITGAIAGYVSMQLHPSFVICGMTGALFGLCGVLAYSVFFGKRKRPRRGMGLDLPVLVIAVISLILGFIFRQGDVVASVTALAAGVLFALVMSRTQTEE